MGSTLTNTQPKDTYKSLLKTSDSSELSATAKYVSDGNGNDSKLALSTGNVGINTTSPNTTLAVKGIGSFLDSDLTDTGIRVGANENYYWQISRENINYGYLAIIQKDNATPVERLRFTETSAGSYLRLASGTGGIQFNGDTAAANALDDYEEGTWSMGIAFGGGSTGVSYSYSTGQYTKVGRKVTVVGFLSISNKGTSTGSATITGLPFTIASGTSNYGSVSFAQVNQITVPSASYISGYGVVGGLTILLQATTTGGTLTSLTDSNFANGSEIMLSFTYFV